MYRLVARDRIENDDVRPYHARSLGAAGTEVISGSAEDRGWDLSSASETSFLLLLGAKQEAETILDEARSKAAAVEQEAIAKGAEQGRYEARQELLPSLIAFADAAQALIVLEEQLIARAAPHLVRLALEIAEKVIERTVAAEPDIVAGVIDRARREVFEAKSVRIWLNPADVAVLRDLRPDLVATGGEPGRTIELATSDDIPRAGCRVETEMGTVDATIPIQLDELRRQLLDETGPSAAAAVAKAARDQG